MIKCVYTRAQLHIHGNYYPCDIYQMPDGVLVIKYNTIYLPDRLIDQDKLVRLFDEDEYNLWISLNCVAVAEFKAVKFSDRAKLQAERNGMMAPIEG